MKIIVAGNCQIDGIARCLRVLAPQTAVECLPYASMIDEAFDLPARLSGRDIIIAGDGGTLDLVRSQSVGSARIFGFPSMFFTGYHPDSIYPDHLPGMSSLLSPTGTNHSAIALAGWRAGLTVAETMTLFNARTFAHLGYFDHWNNSKRSFLCQASALGLNMAGKFEQWTTYPPFMLTPNHPKLVVLAEVARQIAQAAGVETRNISPEQYLAEHMLGLVVWPVYPEIAEPLGFKGNYVFKLQDNGNMEGNPGEFLIDLEEYLQRSFKMYDEAGKDRLNFSRLRDPRYDDIAQAVVKKRTTRKKAGASPYADLPDSSFWRRSISTKNLADIDLMTHGYEPRILPDTSIATAGSCFAQHIASRLDAAGYNHYIAETAPEGMTAEEAKKQNYGLYSARYGNIYSTRQLLQLIKMAIGDFDPADKAWCRADGRYVDPYRPTIQDGGFASPDEVSVARSHHLAAVRRMLAETEIFVFTLGLTEIWVSAADGAAYPLPPASVDALVAPEAYNFVNLSVDEVRGELFAIIDMLRDINPGIRIILTVSPVPLIATYEASHVACATTYSKSVLRVAANEASKHRPNVDYFPSYEIITGSFTKGSYFEDDLRSVSAKGVDHVMEIFFRHYTAAGTDAEPAAYLEQEHRLGRKIICDEENLEPAGKEKSPD